MFPSTESEYRKIEMPSPDRPRGNGLLAFAGHVIVPVDECTLWIVAPSPDMQFEEIGQIKTVWRGDELKVLAIERWRCVVIVLQPCGCVHNVFDAYKPALLSYRFVDQGLWMCHVDQAGADKSAVDVMYAHRPMVGTADAPKCRPIAGRDGGIDIEELLGRLTNILDEFGGRGMSRVLRVLCEERRGGDETDEQRQGQNRSGCANCTAASIDDS